jgi:putative DNA primase/helicase
VDDFQSPPWLDEVPPVSAYEADGRIDFGVKAAPAAEKPAPVAGPLPQASPAVSTSVSDVAEFKRQRSLGALAEDIRMSEGMGDISHDTLANELGASGWNDDAKHVASWGRWLFWTGSFWRVDERLEHMTRTRDFLRAVADDLVKVANERAVGNDEKEAKRIRGQGRAMAARLKDKKTVAAVIDLARSNRQSVAVADDFDADLFLLGTPNGTVDLRTGRLRPALRADMITRTTAVAPANVGERPALWLKFLDRVLAGNAEHIAFMQRAAGYALTGSVEEHKLLFAFGGGRNGKGVFLNTLRDIWGDYGQKASATTFLQSHNDQHSTSIAALRGARLVFGSELPKGRSWNEAVIKDLTGGDRMRARFMRQDDFEFMPQLTLFIAGNTKPSFHGVDTAIRERVVLIPFTVTIPEAERDPGLLGKLKEEWPAILRWAIDGAVEWQRRGLDVPADIRAASKEYLDSEDIVGRFLADETEADANSVAAGGWLYERFQKWCEAEGMKAQWSKAAFEKAMEERGIKKGRTKNYRGWSGLRIKDQHEMSPRDDDQF